MFITFPCVAQAGGQICRCMNAPQLMKSHLCCVSSPPPPSGGECSGVKPHCTAHSAAPQVRAGHCSCGGQHLRVLQWGLNQPVLFFFHSHLFLLLTAAYFLTKAIWKWCPLKQKPFLKCRYFWKGLKSGRAKDLNLWSTIFFSRPFFFSWSQNAKNWS